MELTVLCYGIVTLFNNKIAIICMELLPRTIILIDTVFLFPLSCRNWFPFYLPLYFDYDYYYSL